jgi:hypothetical protein
LVGLRRVDAPQADALAVHFQGVAVDHEGLPDRIGGQDRSDDGPGVEVKNTLQAQRRVEADAPSQV